MSDNGKTEHAIPENEQPRPEMSDVAKEFEEAAHKLRDALVMAWNSKERQDMQEDIRKGLSKMSEEVDKAVRDLRSTETTQKVKAQAEKAADNLQSGKVAEDVRKGLITALRGLSDALDRVASSFTPTEGEEAPKK